MKTKLLIGILFLLGTAILLYPMASDYINSLSQAEVVEHYSDAVSRMEKEQQQQELQRAREYNENLARTLVIDPFTETLNDELSAEYEQILNVAGGMGTLRIPKIQVELPMYHGTSARVLQKGVGHLQNTALPVGGAGTHAVLSGHRGLPSAKLFTDLDKLEIGDRFYIEILSETFAYEVDQIKTVLPTETEDLQPVDDGDFVTLVTCTPYAVNSHRLLVRGKRTEFTQQVVEEIQEQKKEQKKTDNRKLLFFAAVLLCVLVFFYLLIFGSVRTRKRRKRRGRKRARNNRAGTQHRKTRSGRGSSRTGRGRKGRRRGTKRKGTRQKRKVPQREAQT